MWQPVLSCRMGQISLICLGVDELTPINATPHSTLLARADEVITGRSRFPPCPDEVRIPALEMVAAHIAGGRESGAHREQVTYRESGRRA